MKLKEKLLNIKKISLSALPVFILLAASLPINFSYADIECFKTDGITIPKNVKVNTSFEFNYVVKANPNCRPINLQTYYAQLDFVHNDQVVQSWEDRIQYNNSTFSFTPLNVTVSYTAIEQMDRSELTYKVYVGIVRGAKKMLAIGSFPIGGGSPRDYTPIADSIKVCQKPKGSNDTLRVHWQTNGKANSAINYFPQGESGKKKEQGASSYRTDHYLTVTGLQEKVDYAFQVGGRSQESSVYKVSSYGVFSTARHDSGCKDDGNISGSGVTASGDPPPKDPPIDTKAICTLADGTKKTIDLSKGEKCADGKLSCANGSTPTADGLCIGTEVKQLYNPIKSNSLVGLAFSILKLFLGGVAALAIVFIVMGSFRLVVSRGNPEAVTRGKDILIWSFAGLFVALMAFSLVAMVQNLLGAYK